MSEFKILKNDQKILDFLNIKDPKEALAVYPYRYDHNKIIDFKEWKINDSIFFNGVLLNKPTVNRFNRRSLARFQVLFNDNIINCVIFNRTWISKLPVGTKINITGKYTGGGKVTVSNYNTNDLEKELGLHPVYRLTSSITLNAYRKFINKAIKHYYKDLEDLVPKSIKEKYKLLDYRDAIRLIHMPKSYKEVALATRTLKYHEFLRFHLINLTYKTSQNSEKISKEFSHDAVFSVANALNFNLTNDQRIVTNEILSDLSSDKIMNRLLQGDVGSGKTLVAALAMYATVLSNQQTAFMAPTEILAIQQYSYLKKLFRNFDLNIVCLYSALKPYKKQAILEEIENGVAQIIVGTHSLIQDKIKFNNLGFVVIDEQQRFGVKQRESLSDKGVNVDQLLMSATPIPRTMASVIFSEMDVSTIEEMPLGRMDIKTKLILENSMRSILPQVLEKISQGEQVYVVCPAIQDNPESELTNVTSIYQALNNEINKKLKKDIPIGLLHGKLESKDKEQVMDQFKSGLYKILVTTTVIEVGIDVKDANIMVIYDADRFGLSQLHQLRGRVGRGKRQGYCYLLTASSEKDTIERLRVIENNIDGFIISEYDLKLRGPGDLIGVRQSGITNFVLGDLEKDSIMLSYALKDAKDIMENIKDRENNAIINFVHTYVKNYQEMLER